MSVSTLARTSALRIGIVGAGAAGLAAAFALVRRGAAVTVFDAGSAGQGALAASGGMLAAGFEASVEAEESPAFAAFTQAALKYWDAWAPEIEALSGAKLHYERRGAVTPAMSAADRRRLDTAFAQAERLNVPVERRTSAQLRSAEPALAQAKAALVFPGDGQIDNRALGPALTSAIRALGGAVIEQTPVRDLDTSGEAPTIRTASGLYHFDAIICASGAALPGGMKGGPITPVKGQMVAFHLPRAQAPGAIVRGLGIYLAAKPGGLLIAGATSEPGQADTQTDAEAINGLAERARAMLPALEGLSPIEEWAGLRPAASDRMPILGKSDQDGLFLALGGYRNGVLLAPVMGEAVAAAILDGALPGLAQPFAATRFGPFG